MNNSGMFRWNMGDVAKGLVMAVLGGVALPIAAMVQTPGFDIASVNWSVVMNLAFNGAIVAFVTYMTKNLLSSSDGKVLGSIG